jgi:hypothetical protein
MRRNGAPLEEAPEHRPSQHDVRALSATETNGIDSISKLTQQILASVLSTSGRLSLSASLRRAK